MWEKWVSRADVLESTKSTGSSCLARLVQVGWSHSPELKPSETFAPVRADAKEEEVLSARQVC